MTAALTEGRRPPDPAYAEEVDGAFTESFGFSLTTFIRLLRTLVGIPIMLMPEPVGLVKMEALQSWLDSQRLGADLVPALEFLMFERPQRGPIPSRLYESSKRLNTHPIPLTPPGLLVMPSWIALSGVVYAKYLSEGTWPVNVAPSNNSSLARLLEQEEQSLNMRLEREVIEELWRQGLPAYGPIDDAEGSIGRAWGLPGEIDVVAVDVERRVLYVIEAKDERHVHSIKSMDRRIRKWWTDSNSHSSKLVGKVNALSRFAEDAVHAVFANQHALALRERPPSFETPKSSGSDDWEVRGLFVTREPSIAGAYDQRTFPVTWLSDLGAILERDRSR